MNVCVRGYLIDLFFISFSRLVRFTFVRHAEPGIRPDVVLDVALADQHTGVHVMAGTMMVARTLAQRIGVDLVQELLAFAHRKQLARFFALASQTLLLWARKNTKR